MDTHRSVSVVICAFNRETEVVQAVRSALQQKPVPPLEVIVVDDASTDGTAAVAELAGARVIRLPENGGAARARNVGWRAAKGTWVAFLDSDDEWLSHHLETLVPSEDDPHVFVASSAICEGEDSPLSGRLFGSPSDEGLEVTSPSQILFPENPVPLSASIVRRDILEQLGGFDESYRYSEDFDLWLRMSEIGPGRVYGEVTVIYHLHGGQKSGKRASLRAGQDSIIAACGQRAWWSRTDDDRRSAVVAWDDLRHGARTGDRRLLFHGLRDLARNPRRWQALVQVWSYRLVVRRRSSRWTQQGSPSTVKLSERLSIKELGRLVWSPPATVAAPRSLQRRAATMLGIETTAAPSARAEETFGSHLGTGR